MDEDEAETAPAAADPPVVVPPDTAPAPELPWRRLVAAWPVRRREAWGLAANALEAAGTPWREAERLAWERETARPTGPAPAAPAVAAAVPNRHDRPTLFPRTEGRPTR